MKHLIYLLVLLFFASCGVEKSKTEQSKSILLYDSLITKNASELRLLRNEIFARHGYIFESKDLELYFEKFDWYQPQLNNVDSLLSETEKINIEIIQRVEKILLSKHATESLQVEQVNPNERIEYIINGATHYDDTTYSVITLFSFDKPTLEHHPSYYSFKTQLISILTGKFLEKDSLLSYSLIKSNIIDSLKLEEPCSYDSRIYLEIQENLKNNIGVTLQTTTPVCSDWQKCEFFALSKGLFNKLFYKDNFREPIRFNQSTDSSWVAYYSDRDDLVNHFQDDYQTTYLIGQNKLIDTTPNVQSINFHTWNLKPIKLFKTQQGCTKHQDLDTLYTIPIGTKFFMSDYDKTLGTVKIIISEDSIGYLNERDINRKSVHQNAAG